MYQMVDASGLTIRGTQTSSAALGTRFNGDAWTTMKRAERKDNREKSVNCMAGSGTMVKLRRWLLVIFKLELGVA